MQTELEETFAGDAAPRAVFTALRRGALQRCPHCGVGHLFGAYLKVSDHCPKCGEALHHQRADDAPPYLTILVLGHLMMPLVLGVDMVYEWPMWLNVAVWFPVLIGLALILLPVMKGAMIGLQWALRMHGFGGEVEDDIGSRALPKPVQRLMTDRPRPA